MRGPRHEGGAGSRGGAGPQAGDPRAEGLELAEVGPARACSREGGAPGSCGPRDTAELGEGRQRKSWDCPGERPSGVVAHLGPRSNGSWRRRSQGRAGPVGGVARRARGRRGRGRGEGAGLRRGGAWGRRGAKSSG